MPNLLKTFALGLLTTSLIVMNTDQARAVDTLIFGTYAFEKPTTTVRKLRPILDALEQKLELQLGHSIKIKMRVAKSYRAAIADLTAGRVDFGRYGQAAYIMAKAAQRDLKVISVEGDHKKKTFKSVIVVHQNSSIQSFADFDGDRN